jgi:hypothetical protein
MQCIPDFVQSVQVNPSVSQLQEASFFPQTLLSLHVFVLMSHPSQAPGSGGHSSVQALFLQTEHLKPQLRHWSTHDPRTGGLYLVSRTPFSHFSQVWQVLVRHCGPGESEDVPHTSQAPQVK